MLTKKVGRCAATVHFRELLSKVNAVKIVAHLAEPMNAQARD